MDLSGLGREVIKHQIASSEPCDGQIVVIFGELIISDLVAQVDQLLDSIGLQLAPETVELAVEMLGQVKAFIPPSLLCV